MKHCDTETIVKTTVFLSDAKQRQNSNKKVSIANLIFISTCAAERSLDDANILVSFVEVGRLKKFRRTELTGSTFRDTGEQAGLQKSKLSPSEKENGHHLHHE